MEKKAKKNNVWFQNNKLKERKSFFIHILTFWDTKVYIRPLCDLLDNEDHS